MCEGWRIATLFWLESFLDILPPDTHLTIIPPQIWRMESLNPKINDRIVLLSPFHMGKGRNSNSKKKKNSKVNSHFLPVFLVIHLQLSTRVLWQQGTWKLPGWKVLHVPLLFSDPSSPAVTSPCLPVMRSKMHRIKNYRELQELQELQRSSVRQTGRGRCTYINGPLWAIFCFSVHKMLCNLQINVQALWSHYIQMAPGKILKDQSYFLSALRTM